MAEWQPGSRYPDPCVVVVDPSFARYRLQLAGVERLATGMRWAEGPVWLGDMRSLVWSDVPSNCMYRWDEATSQVSAFRKPSDNANGNTRDRHGRILTCEHLTRRVTRTEHDGRITVLADAFDGKRLNSPNDLVVKSDDSIWFTDPTYGIDSDYEGDAAVSEIGASNVYRIDPQTGAVTAVVQDMVRPNGLAFSPDERWLYVVDTGFTHVADGPRLLRRYAVAQDGLSVGNGQLFATCSAGLFDGLRPDVHGNLWVGAGDGVHCLAPDGTLLGKVRVPEVVANVCFGGPKRNRLFICGTTSLYSIYLKTQGLPR